ncbi:MAG: polyprenyl diphosphate synthase [Candidatus Hodarchaeota archaeon]
MKLNLWNKLLYYFYQRRLKKEIKDGPMPEHIGVILDGNRRYAEKFGKDATWGHEKGFDRVVELLDWCLDLEIKRLTLYAFSTENFQRTKEEVEGILKLIKKAYDMFKNDPRIHKNRVKLNAIGRLSLLPKAIQDIIKEGDEMTKGYDDFHLTIAVAYGGRAEIIDSIKHIAEDVKTGKLDIEEINEDTVQANLYKNGPDPDMIIRTSGEKRLSGFLLWQSAYSELYFEDAYFPEFRKIDFWRAVRSFQRRERRYGK